MPGLILWTSTFLSVDNSRFVSFKISAPSLYNPAYLKKYFLSKFEYSVDDHNFVKFFNMISKNFENIIIE